MAKNKFVGDEKEAAALTKQMKAATASVGQNPWIELPKSPPFVLPIDAPQVTNFNKKCGPNSTRFIQVANILPEPLVGMKDAPVVLLSNNAGYTEESLPLRNNSLFMERMRQNLLHASLEYPLVFLAPEFAELGKKWWKRKTRDLLIRFGQAVVAQSILNVTYFPYVSRKFGHRQLRLPSQDYSFRLVREAVKRQAVIVLLRTGREKDWLSSVPELIRYPRLFRVKNPQNPTINRGNCDDFEKVAHAIEARLSR